MPLFVMVGKDGVEGAKARDANRAAHTANVTALDAEGRVVVAGPMRDDGDTRSVGAVIVFEAADLDAARAWVAADPYVAGGVYESVTVAPFRQAFPKRS